MKKGSNQNFLVYLASYVFYGTLVFRVLYPNSPWTIYAVNYDLMMKWLMWVITAIMTIVALFLFFNEEIITKSVTDNPIEMDRIEKLRTSLPARINTAVSVGAILFVGVVGLDWGLWSAMLCSFVVTRSVVNSLKKAASKLRSANR